MKTFKLFFFSLSIIFVATQSSFSQGRIALGLGGAFPVGDFAGNNIEDEDAGGAGTGFNIEFNYIYSISRNGLGLFGGINICNNGLRVDVQNKIRKEFESMGIYNANYKYYSYLNIPVTAGFIYTQNVNGNVSLFTNLGLAADFLEISDMVVSVSSQKVSMKFDADTKIGIKIGGGFLINNTSISVNYLGLGKHAIKSTMSSSGDSEIIEGKQQVGILTLTLGLRI